MYSQIIRLFSAGVNYRTFLVHAIDLALKQTIALDNFASNGARASLAVEAQGHSFTMSTNTFILLGRY